MSKYLITGVGGFVGRYFVEYLQNIEPDSNITGIDIMNEVDMSIQYQKLDITDKSAIDKLIKNIAPDYIIHLASMSSVGKSWEDPQGCFQNNTSVMFNILDSIKSHDFKTRILSIGSSEEYGYPQAKGVPFVEEDKLNPLNPYAIAKVAQEMLCRLYAQSFGVDVVMTRSFNHIGPRQKDTFVIPSLIKQLVDIKRGKKKQMDVGNILVSRDFTDVRDVVDAYYKILKKGQSKKVYNVCSGRSYPLESIINIAKEIIGVNPAIVIDKSLLRPKDVDWIEGDNVKLKELGWKQKYTLKETIQDMIKAVQND